MTTKSDIVPVKRSTVAAPRPAASLFSSLHREIDRLFDQFGRTTAAPFGGAAVSMDMAQTEDGLEMTVELPGLEEKDVQVTLSDRLLTISGEKRAEKEEKDKDYYFIERSYGSFSRSVELPADAQLDKLSATIANGVLKVKVPRTAKSEPKKIEVKSAA